MSKAAKSPTMSAGRVLALLEQRMWRSGAHEVLREVRNGTGYRDRERYADALVVSCWPSRGIWFAGVEVKVSRGDWKRELDDPAKSSEIQKYCSYWWIATPPGVVQPGELPETWGHVEVTEGAHKVIKEAPRLPTEPPSATFVASVLRNAAQESANVREREYRRGYNAAKEEFSSEALEKAQNELTQALSKAKLLERDLKSLQESVCQFENGTGLTLSRWYAESPEKSFLAAKKAVDALKEFDLMRMSGVLQAAATRLAAAYSELEAAKSARTGSVAAE